jgi:hypothetical protein
MDRDTIAKLREEAQSLLRRGQAIMQLLEQVTGQSADSAVKHPGRPRGSRNKPKTPKPEANAAD